MTKLYAPSNNPVTQAWGAEFYNFNGRHYPQGFYRQSLGWYGHNGIDYSFGPDNNAYAAGDGVVTWADWGNKHPWISEGGIVTMIDHGSFYTVYAHLNDNNMVKVGQRVRAGEVVGKIGGTGMVSGPHLHFEVIPKNPNMGNGWYGRSKPVLVSNKPATVAAASGTITKDWFSMATSKDLDAAIDRGIKRHKLRNGGWSYKNTKVEKQDAYGILRDTRDDARKAVRDSAARDAQISNLVSAVAALAKGEKFDEAKLLAGVKAAAEAGVKNAVDSIETTTTVNIKESK